MHVVVLIIGWEEERVREGERERGGGRGRREGKGDVFGTSVYYSCVLEYTDCPGHLVCRAHWRTPQAWAIELLVMQ